MASDPEIVGPGENSHSIDVYALPPNALRAILDKLSEKSQTATKLYNGKYAISLDDVEQFISRIDQEFHACKIINRSATATFILSEQQRFDFRSWEAFETFDTSQSGKTSSLQVELTYNVFRGEDSTLERYVIQLSIQNLSTTASMGIMFGPIAISQPGTFAIPPSPVSCTVRYNNYILGKNLAAAADGWVAGLENVQSRTLKNIQRRSDTISECIFFLATIFGLVFSLQLHSVGIFQLQDWLIYSAMIVFSFSYLGRVIGKSVERNIDRISVRDPLCITRGDRNESANREKRNQRLVLKAVFGFSLFLIQVGASVFSPVILNTLGWP